VNDNRSSVTHLAVHHLPYFHLLLTQLYLLSREISGGSAVFVWRCAHANCLGRWDKLNSQYMHVMASCYDVTYI
jgi:hypothetical protein